MVVDSDDATRGNLTNQGENADDQEEIQEAQADETGGGVFVEHYEADPGFFPHIVTGFTEHEKAGPPEKFADTEREHQRKFRWWALGIIAALCVFFSITTLLFANLASDPAEIQVASDMAKTSIPTLLTLLGAAVAWAFKE
jgi:hypothetical protein